ncbi:MAG: type II toxin-antitoxin system RelE/ParE family toxin [Acidobacteria bacterium]|nr:MAG: type II toxin-antitoxin system RelE/ParE family toxin [Acidobacteriota bacterium]
MVFRVELSDRAQSDIAAIYDWLLSQQAGNAGERWFVALREAIASLSTLPTRCPVSPESQDSPVEVRQLLYGRKPHVYRILFTIDRDVVQVLHVRHGRRRPRRQAVNNP